MENWKKSAIRLYYLAHCMSSREYVPYDTFLELAGDRIDVSRYDKSEIYGQSFCITDRTANQVKVILYRRKVEVCGFTPYHDKLGNFYPIWSFDAYADLAALHCKEPFSRIIFKIGEDVFNLLDKNVKTRSVIYLSKK